MVFSLSSYIVHFLNSLLVSLGPRSFWLILLVCLPSSISTIYSSNWMYFPLSSHAQTTLICEISLFFSFRSPPLAESSYLPVLWSSTWILVNLNIYSNTAWNLPFFFSFYYKCQHPCFGFQYRPYSCITDFANGILFFLYVQKSLHFIQSVAVFLFLLSY